MRTRVTCLTDYNGDFTINILDLSSVLADHQAGDPAADYNEDGVVNQFDQVDFLNQYNPTEGGTCENRSFTYDYRDQLIETAIFDGSAHVSTTTHFYDALKRRTVESLDLPPPAPTGDLGEELRRFVYAGVSRWEIIEELDGVGSAAASLVSRVPHGRRIDDELSHRVP